MKKKDFQSDQVVKWCPGCGDYAILSSVQQALAHLERPKEKTVFVSGIGCSSRFPYYMDTYGFHTIHGRAPTIASGLKIANPDLDVWVITGDGDGLSIGGNHLIHILRRNLDINILLFNNEIYGLTKGQYSPTSEKGKVTKSSPMGTFEQPINPVRLALASSATFVARTYDANPKHMTEVFIQAAQHRGTSFIEILQNCVIFNNKTHEPITARDVRFDQLVHLEEGKPLIYGRNKDRGIVRDGCDFQPVTVETETDIEKCIIHRPDTERLGYANMLADMGGDDGLPTPMGVIRKINKPVYEDLLIEQIDEAQALKGTGSLEDLFTDGEVWEV